MKIQNAILGLGSMVCLVFFSVLLFYGRSQGGNPIVIVNRIQNVSDGDFGFLTSQYFYDNVGFPVVDILLEENGTEYFWRMHRTDKHYFLVAWNGVDTKAPVFVQYFTGGKRESVMKIFVFDKKHYEYLASSSSIVGVFSDQ